MAGSGLRLRRIKHGGHDYDNNYNETRTTQRPTSSFYKYKPKVTMSKKNKIAIFFNDLKEEAQQRIIQHELTNIYDCDPDSIDVDSINVDPDAYGYDEDPKKQELLEHVHVETPDACWLMVWDCFKHEFQTIMEE